MPISTPLDRNLKLHEDFGTACENYYIDPYGVYIVSQLVRVSGVDEKMRVSGVDKLCGEGISLDFLIIQEARGHLHVFAHAYFIFRGRFYTLVSGSK